jgi:hypothetical protein
VTTFADFGIMGGGNNLLYQRSNSNIIWNTGAPNVGMLKP